MGDNDNGSNDLFDLGELSNSLDGTGGQPAWNEMIEVDVMSGNTTSEYGGWMSEIDAPQSDSGHGDDSKDADHHGADTHSDNLGSDDKIEW
ncbi:MAG: hypothetical protein A2063_09625 [Gallionellales bacterium GWA2_60_142]|nr:MAG: hypothetical protein A2063_09625 [Gallionellales bacterium GWA2_60_142]